MLIVTAEVLGIRAEVVIIDAGIIINRKFTEERQSTQRFWRVNQIFGYFCEIFGFVLRNYFPGLFYHF